MKELAATDLRVRAEAQPRTERCGRWEAREIWTVLGENHLGSERVDARNLCQVDAKGRIEVIAEQVWLVAPLGFAWVLFLRRLLAFGRLGWNRLHHPLHLGIDLVNLILVVSFSEIGLATQFGDGM